ncbi:MAG: TrkH family potassium uptake protein [Rhodobacteraceae bacterium]|jgi:trk system potassium uptake protein TrkH|nr:TrkH family potassium uptake protein [Paracoccaceae bacterium]
MRRLADLPLIVILIGIAALAMLVPVAHGVATGEERIARTFFYAATMTGMLAVLLSLATRRTGLRHPARAQLFSLLLAYLVLPLIFAVPFREAVQATSFLNAWFEMVSCLTTTGMTAYEDAGRLAPTLHLWRALVGWLGGLFTWVVALALLAPMNLGGFEVGATESAGQGAAVAGSVGFRPRESGARLVRAVGALGPVYLGLTGILWVCLILSGYSGTPALILAMSTLSTSGITGAGGLAAGGNPVLAEVAIAVFLVFALSRATFTGLGRPAQFRALRSDHELRLGLLIVFAVPAVLFLRHWLGAVGFGDEAEIPRALGALWGAFFTVLSFLTTTGFVSADWTDAQGWSGLSTPGILLAGLAVFGGGVGTTAGGVKLLRVWALYTQAAREMEKLVHPSSVGGSGQAARRLRREGAEIAWIFFMLFAMSLALVSAALALAGIDFENAMVLSVAALSTTGPLAQAGVESPVDMNSLGEPAKAILMAAMVLGRLETLALIALLNPDSWRN